MPKFDFKSRMNPIQETLAANGPDGQITFQLHPFDTDQAFQAHRYQLLVSSGMIFEADEEQFRIGLRRVCGWSGVLDSDGNAMPFNEENFAVFLRMPEAITYLQDVGLHTLMQAKVIVSQEKKVESKDSEILSSQEVSKSNSETP